MGDMHVLSVVDAHLPFSFVLVSLVHTIKGASPEVCWMEGRATKARLGQQQQDAVGEAADCCQALVLALC